MLLASKSRRRKSRSKSLFGFRRSRRDLRLEPLEARRVLAITLSPIGTYETGIFDESAAEIVAYDADTQRLFVTNSNDQAVDVLDMSDPANPTLAFTLPTGLFGAPSSVAVDDGLVAVSVIADLPPQRGAVVFFETDGDFIGSIKVGRNPDMITFTSSSTVKNFVALAEGVQEIQEYPCAVIGPITAETAAEFSLNIVHETCASA